MVCTKLTAPSIINFTMTSGGGYVKMGGGDIHMHCPGTFSIKCSKLMIEGAVSLVQTMPLLPKLDGELGDQFFVLKSYDDKPIANRRYRAMTANSQIEGFTDSSGRTEILEGFVDQIARFELLDESYDEHFIVKDPLGKPMANIRYKIKSGDGSEVVGVTDADGQTNLFTSDKIESVTLFHVEQSFPEDKGAD